METKKVSRKIIDNENTQIITLRIPKTSLAVIQDKAKETGLDVSGYICWHVEEKYNDRLKRNADEDFAHAIRYKKKGLDYNSDRSRLSSLVLFAIITNNQEIELYAQDLSDKLDEDVMVKYA